MTELLMPPKQDELPAQQLEADKIVEAARAWKAAVRRWKDYERHLTNEVWAVRMPTQEEFRVADCYRQLVRDAEQRLYEVTE